MKKLGFVLVAAAMLLVGCEKGKMTEQGVESELQKAPAGGETMPSSASVNVADIMIHMAGGKSVTLPVEIAATDEDRRKGLMGRTELPFKTGGMWFVFPEDVQDPFWMKDTAMPLDMIFVGPDMKIADIKANTTPNSEEKLYPTKDGKVLSYRYVLEVGGGFAAKNGVAIGDTVMMGMGPQ